MSPSSWQKNEYEHVSVCHHSCEQTTAEDLMRNDNARAIRINARAAIEKFRSGLEAIQNDNGPAKDTQTHDMFWDRSA